MDRKETPYVVVAEIAQALSKRFPDYTGSYMELAQEFCEVYSRELEAVKERQNKGETK